MTTVKLILKENKLNARGEMPLYIRITKDRKSRYISLGINVHPNLWDSTNLRVKKQYPNSISVNAYITKKIAEATGIEIDLRTTKQFLTSEKIKEAIKGKPTISFIQYANEYVATLKSKNVFGTYKRIKAVIEKLHVYLKGGDLLFQEFNVAFLKRYENHLREDLKNAPNTIHSNLKVFRKLFNDAIREEYIEQHLNPFLRYKIKAVQTNKGYLTEQEIKAINALEFPENSLMFHHKNMFVFACYAGGIRVSDLLQLKWENYDGTHIRLAMQKTKGFITVQLPKHAQQIVEYYNRNHSNNGYIFPIMDGNNNYSKSETLIKAITVHTAYYNKNLKQIAIAAKIDKHLSSHMARHSFGTLALKKGIGIEYVSKLMGHNSIRTTLIYAKIADNDLDKAMDAFDK